MVEFMKSDLPFSIRITRKGWVFFQQIVFLLLNARAIAIPTPTSCLHPKAAVGIYNTTLLLSAEIQKVSFLLFHQFFFFSFFIINSTLSRQTIAHTEKSVTSNSLSKALFSPLSQNSYGETMALSSPISPSFLGNPSSLPGANRNAKTIVVSNQISNNWVSKIRPFCPPNPFCRYLMVVAIGFCFFNLGF